MGQLVMSFRGLVMHVTKKALPLSMPHRVVAVDASAGYSGDEKDWCDVPPHYCFLEFSHDVRKALLDGGLSLDDSGKYISLRGWSVTLLNPAGGNADIRIGGVAAGSAARPAVDVPCLTDFLPDMVLKEGIADAYVPDWAAFFLDINSGTVTAHKFLTGGIYTTWTVETEGEPMLQFTRMLNGIPQTLTITIPSTPPLAHLAHHVPGSMVVHNGTSDDSDKEFDFVLHFLANAGGVPTRTELKKMFPIDPTTPPLKKMFPIDPTTLRGLYISMTTSCSNSRYP